MKFLFLIMSQFHEWQSMNVTEQNTLDILNINISMLRLIVKCFHIFFSFSTKKKIKIINIKI